MGSLQQVFAGGFDAAAVEPQENRASEPLPRGTYTVEITDAEVKETKARTGTGLKLEYTVVEPAEFARRKVFQFINLRHTSEQAEQIGQSQLSALCRAVGIQNLTDTDQLFQKMLKVGVKIRAASGDYPASNDISAYEALSGAPQVSAMPAARSAAAPAKAAPWKR